MKVNWHELRVKNHIAEWFITEGMSRVGIEQFGEFDPTSLDVQLTINGVEIPLKEAFDRMTLEIGHIESRSRKKGAQAMLGTMVDHLEQLCEWD